MQRRTVLASLAALAVPQAGLATTAVETLSFRPRPRPETEVEKVTRVSASNSRFELWIKAFREKAVARGINGTVYDSAFRGVQYNAYVVDKDRNQSEFTKQIWDYLDTATSDLRVRNGQQALREHASLLNRVERAYGVDRQVVLAIWGLESAYGRQMGDIPVIESLGTLAFDGRRQRFFEEQLMAALTILQSGDTRPQSMKGSWAGAMGHTQFMPTSYLAYAQDLRGDGKRDIWGKDPADALASTANYLKKHGWTKGQPWGLEVSVPAGFDYGLSGERVKKSPADWNRLGVTLAGGGAIPNHGRASILLPAGAAGAAFAIFDNFHVIERYNPADAYVIAVGHLGDRIMGGPPIRHPWPRGEKALSFKQKKEMQRLLRRRGFEVEKIDGIVGPNTIAAIRAFQASIGKTPDGYATTDLLALLKKR
jgi:membrane-bound lytic murein transglycosylase B